ncbi:WD40 repeat domain-containing protein [Burkholderia ubonensis]|uniref:WD40 repeat domain-containing protein n=1 Tax=Burkholderia ubonensis TaxID=101571 RepID=UPI0011612A37|nr:WD40 repeat domain-containing protein [Burkholderia ubonensis]
MQKFFSSHRCLAVSLVLTAAFSAVEVSAESPRLLVDSETQASVLDLRVFEDGSSAEALVFDGGLGFVRQWTLNATGHPLRLGTQPEMHPVCVNLRKSHKAICHGQNAVVTYDLMGGQELQRIGTPNSSGWPFDCGADARCSWVSQEVQHNKLVSSEVADNETLKEVDLQTLQATDIKFDSTGSKLAVALTNRTVQIFDAGLHLKCTVSLVSSATESEFASVVAGTLEYSSLRRPGPALLSPWRGSATALAFDPLGHRLAIGSTTGIHIVETERCSDVQTLNLDNATVTSILFSNSALAAATVDGKVDTWQLKHLDQPPHEVALDGDVANRLVAGRGEGMLFALTDAGRAHLVDLEKSELRGTIEFFSDGRWMMWTPRGQFTGSEGAWQHGKWMFGTRSPTTLPMEAYYKGFFEPDLIEELLRGWARGPDIEGFSRELPVVHIDLVSDQPAQDILAPESGLTHEPERATFHFKAHAASRDAGVSSLLLAHNGIVLKRIIPADGFKSSTELEGDAELVLDSGDNTVEVYAYNKDGVRSPSVKWERGSTGWGYRVEPTTLRVLSVGITNYAVRAYDLTYPAADALLALSALSTKQSSFPLISQRLTSRPVDIHGGNNRFAIPSA